MGEELPLESLGKSAPSELRPTVRSVVSTRRTDSCSLHQACPAMDRVFYMSDGRMSADGTAIYMEQVSSAVEVEKGL